MDSIQNGPNQAYAAGKECLTKHTHKGNLANGNETATV